MEPSCFGMCQYKSALKVGIQGHHLLSGTAAVDFVYICCNPDCVSSVVISEQAILKFIKTNLESLQTASEVNRQQLVLFLSWLGDVETNKIQLQCLLRGNFIFLVI